MSKVVVTVYRSTQELDQEKLLPDRTHIIKLKTLRGIINRIMQMYGYPYQSDICAKLEWFGDSIYGKPFRVTYISAGRITLKKGVYS